MTGITVRRRALESNGAAGDGYMFLNGAYLADRTEAFELWWEGDSIDRGHVSVLKPLPICKLR